MLLAGGANSSGAITAAAELYNPATGQWTIAGSMTSARRFHAAVLLPNGQVLAAGGQDPNFGSLSSAELFNPASGTWQATASMQDSRSIPAAEWTSIASMPSAGGAQASLLANGDVFEFETRSSLRELASGPYGAVSKKIR